MQMVAGGYGVTLDLPQIARRVARRDGRVKFLRMTKFVKTRPPAASASVPPHLAAQRGILKRWRRTVHASMGIAARADEKRKLADRWG